MIRRLRQPVLHNFRHRLLSQTVPSKLRFPLALESCKSGGFSINSPARPLCNPRDCKACRILIHHEPKGFLLGFHGKLTQTQEKKQPKFQLIPSQPTKKGWETFHHPEPTNPPGSSTPPGAGLDYGETKYILGSMDPTSDIQAPCRCHRFLEFPSEVSEAWTNHPRVTFFWSINLGIYMSG